jgi:hypothetical protein
VGRPTRLALAGLDWTLAGSRLGDGADVPVIFKVAADTAALGSTLGLTQLIKASILQPSVCSFFHSSSQGKPWNPSFSLQAQVAVLAGLLLINSTAKACELQ